MKKSCILLALLFVNCLIAQQTEDLNLKGENERVKEGINSGELNRSEIEVISDKKYELKKTTSQAKRDGVITPEERAKITRKDAQLDRTIYKKKHNNK